MDEGEDRSADQALQEAHTLVEPEVGLTAGEAEIEQPEATDTGELEVEAEVDAEAEADADAEDSDEGEWQLAHDPVEGAYYWNTKTMEVPCALSCPPSPICYLLSAAYSWNTKSMDIPHAVLQYTLMLLWTRKNLSNSHSQTKWEMDEGDSGAEDA
jgi:hypothetical protein